MIKKQILSSLLLFFVLTAPAQKEVYFSTENADSIKVKSLNGIELNYSINPLSLLNLSDRYGSSLIPLYIGYFHEKHISSDWTLNSSIGLYNVFSKIPVFQYDTVSSGGYSNYSSISGYQNLYSLQLGVGLEPRWNWGFKQLYQKGKGKLNSGGFLSSPLLFRTEIMHTPVPVYNPGWFPQYFVLVASLTPTIGYRQAISKQLFLETSLGLDVNMRIYYFKNQGIQTSSLSFNPNFKIKAAYTFK